MEAESNRQIGKRLLDQRIYSQALASYKKAEEAFKGSIEEGTSDPLGYIGLCSIQSDVFSLHAESGGKDEAVYLAGKEACLKALQAAPNSASAYLTMGTLNLEWARHLWGADTNAVTILEEAVQVVQHARDLQPEDPKTHKTLGQSYARLAGYHFITRNILAKKLRWAMRVFGKRLKLIQMMPMHTILERKCLKLFLNT